MLSAEKVATLAMIFTLFAACDRSGPPDESATKRVTAGQVDAHESEPSAAARSPSNTTKSADSTTASDADLTRDKPMKIRISFGSDEVIATLADGAAARDFAAMLPLELTLKDYAGKEKVSDLPSKLSLDGEPDGIDPGVGDITHYAPWGNIAIFYRDFDYSKGLVKLGHIDEGVEKIAAQDGPFQARIELLEGD